jgi:hypothetical protein
VAQYLSALRGVVLMDVLAHDEPGRTFDLADGRSVTIKTLPNGWSVWTWRVGNVMASGIGLIDFRLFTESTHSITITLDPQRGGYLASCACGWVAKRPAFYKARAKRFAAEHMGAE